MPQYGAILGSERYSCMGMLKKAASGVLALLPYSRTVRVRSARQKGCGLAGRTFLTIPFRASPCYADRTQAMQEKHGWVRTPLIWLWIRESP